MSVFFDCTRQKNGKIMFATPRMLMFDNARMGFDPYL
jgi:hypothetical protein